MSLVCISVKLSFTYLYLDRLSGSLQVKVSLIAYSFLFVLLLLF